MTSSSSYRALSGLCLLGIVAYCAWITVVPFGFAGAPIAAVVMLGVVLATLKLGAGKPVDYWEAAAEPAQVPRIVVLILLAMTVQVSIGEVLRAVDQMNWVWSNAIYLLVWTVLPLAFIGLGIVRWPRRLASPPTREFLTVAAMALLVATGICYLRSVGYDGPRGTPAPVELAIAGAVTLLGATMEEVIVRVLLLTAIVRASGSRLQALILSSVFFALLHVPAAVAEPIVQQNWPLVSDDFKEFVPQLVWTIGFGFLFGALWLRTGSIILISVVHALCNLGPVLVGGLNAL